jgi:hypothetical protein
MVVWMVAVAALALVSTAGASHDGMLDADALKEQAKQNKALARYLKYNGYPQLAEVRTIRDQAPWDDHEVTLYYLDSRKEISFARARVLGRPEVHLTRYERQLTDGDIRALKARPVAKAAAPSEATPTTCTGNATKRAECAAARAEKAADRVDAAAGRAETAADKTEAIVDKMAARTTKASRAHKTSRAPKRPETASRPEAKQES